jgi:hypothetical protein
MKVILIREEALFLYVFVGTVLKTTLAALIVVVTVHQVLYRSREVRVSFRNVQLQLDCHGRLQGVSRAECPAGATLGLVQNRRDLILVPPVNRWIVGGREVSLLILSQLGPLEL